MAKQIVYGKLRIGYDNLEQLIDKVAKHLGVPTYPVDYLIVKALVRVKAEREATAKRATAEGKEVKVKDYVEL